MTSFFLLGDSISIHYGPLLAERIRVFGTLSRKTGPVGDLDNPEGQNGGDSRRCLAYLRERFADSAFHPDWLLLNCGLHDLRRGTGGARALQVPLPEYRANLETIVALAHARSQRLCWIRTTPVDEAVHNARTSGFRRFAADVEDYNAAADAVCRRRGVPQIDLFGFTQRFCPGAFADHVHFDAPMRERQACFLAGHLERLARDASLVPDPPWGAQAVAPPGALQEALESARRVVVVSHEKPDGDAFGSALALAGFLRAAGRAAVAVGLEPVGDAYRFLRGLRDALPAEGFRPAEGDLVAICDCGAPDRIPATLREVVRGLPSVCIDHHKTNTGFAGPAYLDQGASSTAELIWRLACSAGWPLDPPTAEALWVGLVTDTGRFGYSNTSPAALECAADVLRRGQVDTAAVHEEIYGNQSPARLQLQQRAIASLVRAAGGRVALISLTAEDYAACAADARDSENFVDIARSIRGVDIAAFLYAGAEGRESRLSLRTRAPYDAAGFCRALGGGGHARAAGATLRLPIPAARRDVLERLAAWIAEPPEGGDAPAPPAGCPPVAPARLP